MQQQPDIDAVIAELGGELQQLTAPPTPFREDEFAGLARRVVAFALDTAWYALSLVTLILSMALLVGGGEIRLEGAAAMVVTFGWSLVWEVAWIAAPTRGKPGQRMAGFRVVRPDGGRVSPARAAVRWATRMLAWPTAGFTVLVSAVLVHATGRNQALHDLAAQTVCVRGDALRRIREPQFAGSIAVPPPATPPAAEAPRHAGPFV